MEPKDTQQTADFVTFRESNFSSHVPSDPF